MAKRMVCRLCQWSNDFSRNVLVYVALMMDEPVRIKDATTAAEPPSRILYIRGLTRPFTPPLLKELLGRYGSLVDGEFWLDKIKSQCFAAVIMLVVSLSSMHRLLSSISITQSKMPKMLVKLSMVVVGHRPIQKHYLFDLHDKKKYISHY